MMIMKMKMKKMNLMLIVLVKRIQMKKKTTTQMKKKKTQMMIMMMKKKMSQILDPIWKKNHMIQNLITTEIIKIKKNNNIENIDESE